MTWVWVGMGYLAALAVGVTIGGALRSRRAHTSPYLHEGRWEGPGITGDGRLRRFVWTNPDAKNAWVAKEMVYGTSFHHDHRAWACTIGPGLSHVDQCVCGSTRYGVYGSWS
jgi:hypothetical protein